MFTNPLEEKLNAKFATKLLKIVGRTMGILRMDDPAKVAVQLFVRDV